MKEYNCCLCHKHMRGWGNNPWPLDTTEDARCCDECNWSKVIPARLQYMTDDERIDE